MAGHKRGPREEPMAIVALKNNTHQVQRAQRSGRAELEKKATEALSAIPALDRETPEELLSPLAPVQWRKRIVDSVGGLKILRKTDEPLVDLVCNLLARCQALQLDDIPLTIRNEKGDEVENPKFKLYLKLVAQVTKILADLGLNPSTRARVLADTASAMKDVSQTSGFNFARE